LSKEGAELIATGIYTGRGAQIEEKVESPAVRKEYV